MSVKCYNCNKEINFEAGAHVGRQDTCDHCYASMHSCKMCHFYDQASYNECKEPTADRIVEKEKANFCDFFKLSGAGDSGASKDDLLSAAAALFKK